MKIEYLDFWEGLEQFAYIEIDGVRYMNNKYTGEGELTILTLDELNKRQAEQRKQSITKRECV